MRASALFALLSLAFPLGMAGAPNPADDQAAVRPSIDVNPNGGSPAGGDLVNIFLKDGLTNGCALILTCSPAVTFDGIPGTVIRSGTTYLVVKTPAHPRGDVSLSVYVGATYTASFHFLTEEDYEAVLLPVNIAGEVPGAFGSRWTTDSRIANDGQEAVDVKWAACQTLLDPPCPPFQHLPPGGEALRLSPDTDYPKLGALFYIPRWALAQVHVNSRVQDLSRDAETWGTEQPVIRTSAFQRAVTLLNIPNDSRFRTTLRIYGAGAYPLRARIRIWPLGNAIFAAPPVVDDTRTLAGIVSVLPISFPAIPAYAQIALESYPVLVGQGPLRIEVSSVDNAPLWALASVTNNATQHVTLVTPQP